MGHTLTKADAAKGASITNAIKRAKKAKLSATAQAAYDLMDSVGREGVTVQSVVATLALSDLLINHEVEAPQSAAELEAVAKALKIAHTIMRLEHNESTSNAAVSAMTPEERTARMVELRQRMAAMTDTPTAT